MTDAIAAALETVQRLQSEYWDALSKLEKLTGLELSAGEDYAAFTVRDLQPNRDQLPLQY